MTETIVKIFTGDLTGSDAADAEVAALGPQGYTVAKKLLSSGDKSLTVSPAASPADFGQAVNKRPDSLWVIVAVK